MEESKKFYDHLGNSYPSLRAMCSAYKITTSCYLKRTGRGVSKRDALTIPMTRHYYKYDSRLFRNRAGLMAYIGLPESEYHKIKNKVIYI